MVAMKRYLDEQLSKDLQRKTVVLTGPRQVGKTTLARQLMQTFPSAQYLNWDVAADRAILQRQSWSPRAHLLVLDEINKMAGWKNWLKGVADGKPSGQALLVTGNARMETFRQSGESLAGRYFALRLHPISVREWCEMHGDSPDAALDHLIARGGFPEPCPAEDPVAADPWRQQYFTDLIREDVVEFSRIHEINAMRLFVELLRERVDSPRSLASIARDLAVSPATLKRCLEILQALFIVFAVPPWHHNIARAILQTPKVYFFDTGLVRGDEGVRYENAVATMLRKHVDFLHDTRGMSTGLHYIRTKDGAEIDLALSDENRLTHLIECKLPDTTPHRALAGFAERFLDARAVQQEELRGRIEVLGAAPWLLELAA